MSTNNRLFFSHGDKGGVGKSMLSALLVDHLLQIGREVAVIEGDKGADIAERFAGLIKVEAENLNRSGASNEAVIGFIDKLSKLSDDGVQDVVINLPSGAGDTLEELAPAIIESAEMIGFVPFVFYSLGHQPVGTANALRSLKSGLLDLVNSENRCMVYPAFQGTPDKFDWVTSGNRDKFDIPEIVIPAISPNDLAVKVLGFPGRFSDLVRKDSPLTYGERAIFQHKWLRPALSSVSIFDNKGA
ncbi:ATP-binding protein [Acidithiobacillus thiooxidans]|uniref:CobQ/CobB/MinD/ParA nucleotide binding domain-containing protein n=1 Tax=Acidithiobacillus thiooxidans ATCC 19377 TaxID=637390 RepID=A0A543Q3K1_ACITH|nr:ATP-binding protein [Acidithiobacillus thiooxidans]MDX5934961.1 ATP-binding protein [Acidithiobacillus thiooxidans]TQN50913.1 hypothetical protein DLNHIDIE_00774 [Acidithiobacillus thiooxidans ATCC 19377]